MRWLLRRLRVPAALIPGVVAGLSGRIELAVVVVVIVVVVALCWILADNARSANLTAVLIAARGDARKPRRPRRVR